MARPARHHQGPCRWWRWPRTWATAVGYLPGLTGAPHRRPDTRQRQDRREGRGRHRRRGQEHAPHPARYQHLRRGRGCLVDADWIRAWTWLARSTRPRTGSGASGSPTQIPPSPRAGAGALAGRTTPPGRPVAAWPTPAEPRRPGTNRCQTQEARVNRPGFDGGSDDTEGSLSWDRRSIPMSCASEPRG